MQKRELEARVERRVEIFQEIFDKVIDLFRHKNTTYRDAIRRTGLLGASVELVGISARLEALVIKDPSHGAENATILEDILLDAFVYSGIALQMLQEENFDGE